MLNRCHKDVLIMHNALKVLFLFAGMILCTKLSYKIHQEGREMDDLGKIGTVIFVNVLSKRDTRCFPQPEKMVKGIRVDVKSCPPYNQQVKGLSK